jgi:hypothetical protein
MGIDAHRGAGAAMREEPLSCMLTRPTWRMVEEHLHGRHWIKIAMASAIP